MLQQLKIICGSPSSSIEEAAGAARSSLSQACSLTLSGIFETMRLKAEENAQLDGTWCHRRAMFGAGEAPHVVYLKLIVSGSGYEAVPLRLSDEERQTLKVPVMAHFSLDLLVSSGVNV